MDGRDSSRVYIMGRPLVSHTFLSPYARVVGCVCSRLHGCRDARMALLTPITGTNAVLEGKGARTALIVTAGHKDVLSVRRSQIPGGLGAWINFIPPAPIVPLESTVQCHGMMSSTGEIVTPINEAQLREDLVHLKKQKPEAVTISLLNSYQNAAHEKTVAKILREELGSEVEIVCSADVLPEVGEYERTVTASANAIVKPVVKKYLANLSMLLKEDSETIRILKSDGGLTTLDLAGELPVNILM